MKFLAVWGMLLGGALTAFPQAQPRFEVGPLPDGGFLLNSGWRIGPAGRQIPLEPFPMASAVSPDGRYVLALQGGGARPSIAVLSAPGGQALSRTPVPDAFVGLIFSARGDRVYVGGGSQAAVYEYSFSEGRLAPMRTMPVTDPAKRTPRDFTGDIRITPDGRFLYAADLFQNTVTIINLSSGIVIERFATGRRPYRILFHPDGKSVFITSWADGTLYHHEVETGKPIGRLRLGPHPTDMVWRPGGPIGEEAVFQWTGRLFITASNTNQVYVVGVSAGREMRVLETINLAIAPRQPAGMTPSALSLAPDGARLYVACSDFNAIAVADVELDRSIMQGFIPAGWYPTSVQALADGTVVILNGRGSRPGIGEQNPVPLPAGSASFVAPYSRAEFEEFTRQAILNSPYRDTVLDDAGADKGSPIPGQPGAASPIRHVVYIVKGSRSYDEVLGGMKEGKGDASLVRFGEDVTPNHHKLAREFVLFDNFYVNGDVSADGHNWSAAGIAPLFVQKLWPATWAQRRRQYDYEGGEPAAVPPAAYLWTNAFSAGLSLRNYGWWVTNLPQAAADGRQVREVRDGTLAGVTNQRFRGFDFDYPDTERAKVFLEDLAAYEGRGEMPRLITMHLGNGRAYAKAPGRRTQQALIADHDHALGLIVEGITRSKFWPQTAIFVVEADAQDGRDHVASHRSLAYVISQYSRRGTVDSSFYNTLSVLRTMELILGLRPMTHFDAAARPILRSFQEARDPRPYRAEVPRVPLDARATQ